MSIHPIVQSLLAEIASFRDRSGMSVTAFGMSAVRDPGLIRRLEGGHSPTLKTVDRIRNFMRDREGVMT